MKKVNAPLKNEDIKGLKAGDEVLLSGRIYTARDQAHRRMEILLKKGRSLPIDIKGEVIYYCGPTPSRDRPIGSCGPTTSSRMDRFTPMLLTRGLKGMIGKGSRGREVIASVKNNQAVYFVAPAGCGAFLSEKVKESEIVAFEDLGTEAIRRLSVQDMPLIVAVDSEGGNIFNHQKKGQ